MILSLGDCYHNLANAIIVQAVNDYRKARYILKRYPRQEAAQRTVEEVERFFLSDWFRCLTTVDGTNLMRKLREEA